MQGDLSRFIVALCLFGMPLLQAQQKQLPPLQGQTQQQPQLHEEVTVRWWLVPVYAVDKAGAPVLDLTPDDLEVYIKNIRVEKFDIHKKQFQVRRAKKARPGRP